MSAFMPKLASAWEEEGVSAGAYLSAGDYEGNLHIWKG